MLSFIKNMKVHEWAGVSNMAAAIAWSCSGNFLPALCHLAAGLVLLNLD